MPAAMLSFEEFKRVRRQNNGSVPPMIPLPRGRGSRDLAREQAESMMSFDEFREMRRLLGGGRASAGSGRPSPKKKKGRGASKRYGAAAAGGVDLGKDRASGGEKKERRQEKETKKGGGGAAHRRASSTSEKSSAKSAVEVRKGGSGSGRARSHSCSGGANAGVKTKNDGGGDPTGGRAKDEGRGAGAVRLSGQMQRHPPAGLLSPVPEEKPKDPALASGRRQASDASPEDRSADGGDASRLREPAVARTGRGVSDVFERDEAAARAIEAIACRALSGAAPAEAPLNEGAREGGEDGGGTPDDRAAPSSASAALGKAIAEARELLTITATNSIVEEEGSMPPLPEGMPLTLEIPEDWEFQAGFGAGGRDPRGPSDARSTTSRSTLDTVETRPPPVGSVEEWTARLRDGADGDEAAEEPEKDGEEEDEDDDKEDGEGIDARNASMWVVCDKDEDLDDDEEDMDAGDVVIGPFEEEAPDDPGEEEDRLEEDGGIGFVASTEDVSRVLKETASTEDAARVLSGVSCQDAANDTPGHDTGYGEDDDETYIGLVTPPAAALEEVSGNDNDDELVQDAQSNIGATPNITKSAGEELDLSHFSFKKLMPVAQGEQLGEALVRDQGESGRNEERNASGKLLLKQAKARLSDAAKEASKAAGTPKPSKRELKGRILLIRIRKKISRVGKIKGVMKRMFFLPFSFKSKGGGSSNDDGPVISVEAVDLSSIQVPSSPSAVSVISIASGASVASSVLRGNGKAIIGATPAKSSLPAPAELLYGAINYGDDRSTKSDVDDLLPPPPTGISLPLMASTPRPSDEEDVISYLAEAMKNVQGNEDEESVILLLTPGEDGAEEMCQVISGVGTPSQTPLRDDDVKVDESSCISSEVSKTPSNLAHLFKFATSDHDDSGNDATSIQIMDAVEVEGGYILTPTGESSQDNGAANVFRCSMSEGGRRILPGSVIDSDDDEEDGSLLFRDGKTSVPTGETAQDCAVGDIFRSSTSRASYNTPYGSVFGSDDDDDDDDESTLYHDGCTAIHQADTFGDETIETVSNAPTLTKCQHGAVSPKSLANESISSSTSRKKTPDAKRNIKKSPKSAKSIPKSAAKTKPKSVLATAATKRAKRAAPRGSGLVKSRVSDIQQRIEVLSAASSFSDDASSHINRQRNSVGGGSHASTVRTQKFYRSVPIGIAKSRDSYDGGISIGSGICGANIGIMAKGFDGSHHKEEGGVAKYA